MMNLDTLVKMLCVDKSNADFQLGKDITKNLTLKQFQALRNKLRTININPNSKNKIIQKWFTENNGSIWRWIQDGQDRGWRFETIRRNIKNGKTRNHR